MEKLRRRYPWLDRVEVKVTKRGLGEVKTFRMPPEAAPLIPILTLTHSLHSSDTGKPFVLIFEFEGGER